MSLAMAATVAAPAGAATSGTAKQWRVVDLGALGGPRNSSVSAINDSGTAVGRSSVDDVTEHAFLWRAGRMTDLGTLGGTDSWATDVNNRGEVVGYSRTAADQVHAFLWRAGRMIDLGTVSGTFSLADGINERGDVVGYGIDDTATGGYQEYAFLWRHGRMTRLPEITEGAQSRAYDVNERGVVLGSTVLPGTMGSLAVTWQAGAVRRLAGLPGIPEAINDRGDVVSSDSSQDGMTRGYLWSKGLVTQIGPPDTPMHPFGINNRGQIAGAGWLDACFWERGELTLLPSPFGYGGEVATDLNASGQVVGNAVESLGGPWDARFHAVLWTRQPVRTG
jgi:probable HAF family extracellular repeat protein